MTEINSMKHSETEQEIGGDQASTKVPAWSMTSVGVCVVCPAVLAWISCFKQFQHVLLLTQPCH